MMTLSKVIFYSYWTTTNGKIISFSRFLYILSKCCVGCCDCTIISRICFLTFICEVKYHNDLLLTDIYPPDSNKSIPIQILPREPTA